MLSRLFLPFCVPILHLIKYCPDTLRQFVRMSPALSNHKPSIE
jgi:hypothetical protein